MNDLEDVVIELQTRVAFQEDTLAQLNDVVTLQDKEIRQLKEQIFELTERVKDAMYQQSQSAATIVDERPPHY